MAKDIDTVLPLAATAVLLRAGVPPNFLPQIQAKGLEGGRVVRRIPDFNIGTHAVFCHLGATIYHESDFRARARGAALP